MTSKRLAKAGLVVLVAISLFVCPLVGGPGAVAEAPRQGVTFEPHIPTPFSTPITMPTLIPTLGPGQYFSSDDKPAVITTVGDDEFGYGEIAGHPDLYLVWVTDEAGTHYLVVDSKSTRFLGSESQDTFSELLKQRGSLLTQIGEKENLSRREQGQRYGYDGGAVAVAIVGVIACIIVTAGGCFLPFAAGALVLVGNAAAHNGASQAIQEDIPPLEASLDQVDSSLLGRFGALSTRTPSP